MVAGVRGATAPASSPTSNNAVETDVPSEAEMGALFEAAMRQQQTAQKGGAEPKVTPEEQHKFLSAMKQPEFRSLLNEYMQEISDPSNRAETERYLSQLEGEQKVPTDKQLVKPTPGFVVKTKWEEATHKIFINVCSSDKMQPPSSTKVAIGQQGTSWNLPYSLGPERLEQDKGGSGVPTFDVCFHPRVIEFAMARPDYRHMVISTCLDAVEPILRESRRKPNALLAKDYHILKGVAYKSGDPVTMCLRKEREAPEPTKSKKTKAAQSKPKVQAVTVTKIAPEGKMTEVSDKENAPPPQSIKRVDGKADDSVLNQLTHVEQSDKSSPLLMKESSSTKVDTKPQLDKLKQAKKMEHQLIYRGRFELLHHMQADPGKNVPEDRYRPKELVVEVSFPLSSSAKDLDLDVSERLLRLSAGPSVPGNYEPLELALPFPVIEDKGSAKFDRKNHKLIVTLPVQPPPKPKPQSVSLIVQDDDEEEEELAADEPTLPENSGVRAPKTRKEGEDEFRMLRETALMVANDPQVLARKQRKAQAQPAVLAPATRPPLATVTEPAAINDDIYDDLPPLESCSDEEEDDAEEAGAPPSVPTATESASEAAEPIKPPFETHDTPTCLSYIVAVAGIDKASVKLTFPSSSSLRLQFSDSEKRVYEMQVAMLPVDVDPSTAEFDVASENMVVILQKKNATAASTSRAESSQKAVQIDAPAPLAAATFQNQLLYELD
ncbi:Protein kintoun [Phytophthora pseudosyringae]|uniref:Protein kintoun n=1 Tax=Phytophthora pseudosyringae TaxID=221518 RepID=A0A8T1VZN9_9STRA|nr:Protein kintoun [Phytophthora pseudosyringae]